MGGSQANRTTMPILLSRPNALKIFIAAGARQGTCLLLSALNSIFCSGAFSGKECRVVRIKIDFLSRGDWSREMDTQR